MWLTVRRDCHQESCTLHTWLHWVLSAFMYPKWHHQTWITYERLMMGLMLPEPWCLSVSCHFDSVNGTQCFVFLRLMWGAVCAYEDTHLSCQSNRSSMKSTFSVLDPARGPWAPCTTILSISMLTTSVFLDYCPVSWNGHPWRRDSDVILWSCTYNPPGVIHHHRRRSWP